MTHSEMVPHSESSGINALVIASRGYVICVGNPNLLHHIFIYQNIFVDSKDEAQWAKLKEAILAHLRSSPLAADTAEGVIACWLPSAGFEDAPDLIDAVLEEMVQQRLLVARTLPDGKTLYARGTQNPPGWAKAAEELNR